MKGIAFPLLEQATTLALFGVLNWTALMPRGSKMDRKRIVACGAGLLAMASAEAVEVQSLHWGAPVDVRVVEHREETGRPRLDARYTIRIERLPDGNGYQARVRGLGDLWLDGKPALTTHRLPDTDFTQADDEFIRGQLMPPVRLTTAGELDGPINPIAVSREFHRLVDQVAAKWEPGRVEIARGNAAEALALQRRTAVWRWMHRAAIEPGLSEGEQVQYSLEQENTPSGLVTLTHLGASPLDSGLIRLVAKTSISPGAARDNADRALANSPELAAALTALPTISFEETVVADVEPGSLRPRTVEASHITRVGDHADSDRRVAATLKLEWVDPPGAGADAPIDVGTCRPFVIEFPAVVGIRGEAGEPEPWFSCATGIAVPIDGGSVTLKREGKRHVLFIEREARGPFQSIRGEFEFDEGSFDLRGDEGEIVGEASVSLVPGHRWAYANFEYVGIRDAALQFAFAPGVDLSGEEKLANKVVSMRFDAIPIPSLLAVMAMAGSAELVQAERRFAFIGPSSGMGQSPDEEQKHE